MMNTETLSEPILQTLPLLTINSHYSLVKSVFFDKTLIVKCPSIAPFVAYADDAIFVDRMENWNAQQKCVRCQSVRRRSRSKASAVQYVQVEPFALHTLPYQELEQLSECSVVYSQFMCTAHGHMDVVHC